MKYKNEHGVIGNLIATTADGFFIFEDDAGNVY